MPPVVDAYRTRFIFRMLRSRFAFALEANVPRILQRDVFHGKLGRAQDRNGARVVPVCVGNQEFHVAALLPDVDRNRSDAFEPKTSRLQN